MNGKITLAMALGVVTLGMLAPAARADWGGYYRGGYRTVRVVQDGRRERVLNRVSFLRDRIDCQLRDRDMSFRTASDLRQRLCDVEDMARHDRYLTDGEYDRCQLRLDSIASCVRAEGFDRHR